MDRYLTMIEVSQKQAYIFASNKLRDNISRSETIAMITGTAYVQRALDLEDVNGIDAADHLVYAGGGHAVFEFAAEEEAKAMVRALTGCVLREFPEIALFAKTIAYDAAKTPGQNMKELTGALEKKKAVRRASFHQISFGVERVDAGTGKSIRAALSADEGQEPQAVTEIKSVDKAAEHIPDGFTEAAEFERLGGSRGESGFIAVVHIDGNAMGRRVTDFSARFGIGSWDEYKQQMRAFSESIARDYEAAYDEMTAQLAQMFRDGGLTELDLQKRQGKTFMPVRRIISEGDDLCFVSEGRIGIALAARFLKILSGKKNIIDGLPYAACAGVALVHRKYPFYRAYQLAEVLCKNAKRYPAEGSKGDQAGISAIDWHIAYGELQDSLDETRRDYVSRDGKALICRPYLVSGTVSDEAAGWYGSYRAFETLMKKLTSDQVYSSGLLKGMRPVLKKGDAATKLYLNYHKASKLAADQSERRMLFDAIEVMDTYLPLKEA